ncbi:hypothetical protein [Actinocorallia populi]|uniref:hypothetical protein n=1 Tax=Actinocorallia populi TaxID=2079200 RepID=UPI000D0926E7|nr:hypothetical protein [Actinocorallia populi]
METAGIGLAAAAALSAVALTACETVRFRADDVPAAAAVGLGAAVPYPWPPAPREVPPSEGGGAASGPERLVLPLGTGLSVLDPRELIRTARVQAPSSVQSVVPAPDGRTFWAVGPRMLLPVDPRTLRAGAPVRVRAALHLVFARDGSTALLLTSRRLELRDPETMAPRSSFPLPCAPTARPALTADGAVLVTACGRTLLGIDWAARTAETDVRRRERGPGGPAPR